MNLTKRTNSFQFENYLAIHDEIHPLHGDWLIPIFHGKRLLDFKWQLPVGQLQTHRVSVNNLNKPWAQLLVNGNARIDERTEE